MIDPERLRYWAGRSALSQWEIIQHSVFTSQTECIGATERDPLSSRSPDVGDFKGWSYDDL